MNETEYLGHKETRTGPNGKVGVHSAKDSKEPTFGIGIFPAWKHIAERNKHIERLVEENSGVCKLITIPEKDGLTLPLPTILCWEDFVYAALTFPSVGGRDAGGRWT
eukprot:1077848-Prorocentrum_minimum.AAC.1